jgi:hemin uptake protein HemP
MNIKTIAVAALAISAVTPALAAEFYVVRDTVTKKCTVVDAKPTVATTTVVSPSGKVYTTHDEAEAALKTTTVCETK